MPIHGRVRLFATLALVAAWLPAPPAQAPDLRTVLERVGRYVEEYHREFSRLVCDERYTQESREPRLGPTAGFEPLHTQRRRLVSEFALARLEAGGGWLWQGFRDVIEVDGRPVRTERNRLEALFSSSPADLPARARAIADESARYNLGQYRTINVPTLALEFLVPDFQARQSYEQAGEESVSGVHTWRVAFEELSVPTVIRTPDGDDVPCNGIAWIDVATGRVVRTLLEPRVNLEQKSKIIVTYAPDRRFGIWVPVTMEESYETAARSVTGRATYSNCRRFETTARIKNEDQ